MEIRKFMKEEEDGSKTYTYADKADNSDVYKTHNTKGPAIVNKKQDISEYYLYGVKLTKDEWEKKRKFS